MPTPSRTSVDAIVAAARSILEAQGLEGLTMQAVASLVGVRAPSLYKRVKSRGDLIHLVANDAARGLATTLDAAATTGDPRRDLGALASAFRAFALTHPEAYRLLFAPMPEEWRVDPALNRGASDSLLRTTSALVGPTEALEAARTVVAWATGFVAIELAGGFRLGGDVDRAFAYGVDRLTRGIAG